MKTYTTKKFFVEYYTARYGMWLIKSGTNSLKTAKRWLDAFSEKDVVARIINVASNETVQTNFSN